MSDADLAAALRQATAMESAARIVWQTAGENLVEKDNALIVGRHATAMRKALERWIGVRAVNGSTIGSF